MLAFISSISVSLLINGWFMFLSADNIHLCYFPQITSRPCSRNDDNVLSRSSSNVSHTPYTKKLHIDGRLRYTFWYDQESEPIMMYFCLVDDWLLSNIFTFHMRRASIVILQDCCSRVMFLVGLMYAAHCCAFTKRIIFLSNGSLSGIH